MFFCLAVEAKQMDSPGAFASTTFENDVFFKDDGLYTNGLFFTWGYNQVDTLDEQHLPDWIATLAKHTHLTSSENKQHAISYGFGQLFQTSIDISKEELVEEDAPYVGLLAWQVKLLTFDESLSDEASLILGVVGEMAGGEFTQSVVHSINDANQPAGWDNQIDNELVFRLQTRRTWRLYNTEFENRFFNSQFDWLVGVDGGVGNLRSDLGAGVGFRFGQQLDKNFGSASVFPVQKFNRLNYSPYGWYVFANLSANIVANDIFINGNTFHESHSVNLNHQQLAISAGFMANIYDFSIIYTALYITDEYEGQAEPSRFGSISIAYHF
ncbi:lipid A deacylase LpxR family protein [Psychromonas sp. KJ10-10]|uniref:lipid A deacylase LpxR family protein n=1 Tax=Psychromonas sp. KJ10-10 TaxID=3391823 RepID=UPI0039B3B725